MIYDQELVMDNYNGVRDVIKERLFKSCLEEIETPVTGTVYGNLPTWLKGSLLRNGPGLFDIGKDQFRLYFDGMAMFHKYTIENGVVTYKNKFLKSDSYTKNMAANRIVITELGTVRHPDPCKNIFQRFMSWFTEDKESDNCNVNFVNIGDGIYAVSEMSKIHRIDQETLDSVEQVQLRKYISAYTYTAHPQRDADGNVYNFGQSVGSKGMVYSLMKFPPEEGKRTFEKASIVTQIPSRSRTKFSYYHSFGMTDRYFIFVEQSLQISLLKMLKSNLLNEPTSEWLEYNDIEPVKFFVIEKETGIVRDTVYVTSPFFFFHTINAYEENAQLVFDLASYDNADFMRSIERFSKLTFEQFRRTTQEKSIRRFVIPLNINSEVDKNMVNLDYTNATARLQPDGSIFLEPELMNTNGYVFELPQLNPAFARKKYRYTYGLCYNSKNRSENPTYNELLKFDFHQKEMKRWFKDGYNTSEPIFVPAPNPSEEEDGVILSAAYSVERENSVYLAVLDAKSFEELAWVEFETPSAVPICIHGMFLNNS